MFYPNYIKNIDYQLKKKYISVFIEILREQMNINMSLINRIEKYFEVQGLSNISCLLITKVNFECCFEIVNNIF